MIAKRDRTATERPPDRRLTELVRSAGDVRPGIRDVARRIASAHLGQPHPAGADGPGSTDALLAAWGANQQILGGHADLLGEPQLPASLFSQAREYVSGRGRLFAERVRDGRPIVGRGRLRADDIYVLADGTVLSGVGDGELPWGEGLPDLCALAFDFEVVGAPALGTELLNSYLESASDRPPTSLVHHYLAFAAQSRAATACLRAERDHAKRAPIADRSLRAGARHADRATVRLAVGARPDDGDWEVLDFDRVKQNLAALATSRSRRGEVIPRIYGPTLAALTYGELLHRAEEHLQHGESVILGGEWSDTAWAEEARRLAGRARAEWTPVTARRSAPTTERSSPAR